MSNNENTLNNEDKINTKVKPNFAAILPILVFLIIYLGNGLYFEYVSPIEGKMGFYITSVVVSFGIGQ